MLYFLFMYNGCVNVIIYIIYYILSRAAVYHWLFHPPPPPLTPHTQLKELHQLCNLLKHFSQFLCNLFWFQSKGLHFRHTDNINYFFKASEKVGLPKVTDQCSCTVMKYYNNILKKYARVEFSTQAVFHV